MTSKIYASCSIGAVAVSLLLAGSSFAADLPSRKAPIVAPSVPVFTWTGFYVGVTAGLQNLRDRWTTTGTGIGIVDNTSGASLNSTNFRLGGYAGYNWQMGQTVVGLEGDFAGDFGSNKTLNGIPGTRTFITVANLDSVTGRANWDASIRARAGYLITPAALLYATGGVAFQNVKHSINCPGNTAGSWCFQPEAGTSSTTRTGWTLGAGIEAAVGSNWLVRAEYRYSDFGSNTTTYFAGRGPAGADAITGRINLTSNIFSVGAAYKF